MRPILEGLCFALLLAVGAYGGCKEKTWSCTSADMEDSNICQGGEGLRTTGLTFLQSFLGKVKGDEDLDEPEKIELETKHYLDAPEACTLPLVGTRNRKFIGDEAITASSHWAKDGSTAGPPVSWEPSRSRIDMALSCWLADTPDNNQWIQWDFGAPKKITHIQTKGRLLRGKEGDEQWVTSYTLQYSQDGQTWTQMNVLNGTNDIFEGNIDRWNLKENKFDSPVVAKLMKLHPQTWHHQIAMRVEFLGCDATTTTTAAPPVSPCMACSSCISATASMRDDTVEWASQTLDADYTVATNEQCSRCALGASKEWPCTTSLCRCNLTMYPVRQATYARVMRPCDQMYGASAAQPCDQTYGTAATQASLPYPSASTQPCDQTAPTAPRNDEAPALIPTNPGEVVRVQLVPQSR